MPSIAAYIFPFSLTVSSRLSLPFIRFYRCCRCATAVAVSLSTTATSSSSISHFHSHSQPSFNIHSRSMPDTTIAIVDFVTEPAIADCPFFCRSDQLATPTPPPTVTTFSRLKPSFAIQIRRLDINSHRPDPRDHYCRRRSLPSRSDFLLLARRSADPPPPMLLSLLYVTSLFHRSSMHRHFAMVPNPPWPSPAQSTIRCSLFFVPTLTPDLTLSLLSTFALRRWKPPKSSIACHL